MGRNSSRTTYTKTSSTSLRKSSVSNSTEEAESSSDSEPELYFYDPMQLLTIFSELEDQNLSLIQNGQDTEENIEEIKNQAKITKDRLTREVKFLENQIEMLESSARREEEKTEDMKMKCEMFSFGEFDEDDQQKLLKVTT